LGFQAGNKEKPAALAIPLARFQIRSGRQAWSGEELAMTVAAILRGKPERLIGLEESSSLAEASQLLVRERIGALIVRNAQGEMIGIISERDIVRAVARDGAAATARPLSQMMTRDVLCCAPEDSVVEVMAVMTQRRFRHLPVKKAGKLIGMVSIGDVVKQRVEEAEREAASLRDYIAS
jgi:CBS domain-containing protein